MYTGLLKRYILQPFDTCGFSTKLEGNHHLQGNVQLYNVRIPDIRDSYFLMIDWYCYNHKLFESSLIIDLNITYNF